MVCMAIVIKHTIISKESFRGCLVSVCGLHAVTEEKHLFQDVNNPLCQDRTAVCVIGLTL
jgi:hypothetical protein